ncbi:cytochrome P450 [Ectocarpus siliculosus]|uniref:Cytochrome P450 n=1 Tax=Ectocarpus siliculosus TaxID=2880 RepID=D8LC30_ECTSI|nr:cytochrome P450 [Ectocarpus siliculosus]|eukprot:CBN79213.1 cytochrome P450 [Ectocarpus siliculosus]
MMEYLAGRKVEVVVVGSVAMLAWVALSYYWWWRSSEAARVKNFVRSHSSSDGSLPSPMPALPRWCGFIGGHTLVMQPGETVWQLEGWAKEFGGDYELYLAGNKVTVVSGLSDIRRILTLRPSKFKRGIVTNQTKWASEQVGVQSSLFFEEGKTWGRSRRLISPNLNGHNVAAMLPIIAKVGERFCGKLGDKADAREVVTSRDSFARFTHDIVALAAFGVDVGAITATEEEPCPSFDAIERITSALISLMGKPAEILKWKYLPMVPWVRETKQHSRRLENVIQGAVNAVRADAKLADANLGDSAAEGDVGIGGTMLRKIIGATNGSANSSDRMLFNERELMHQANGLFVAATETTALTLCWCMYYLTKNPKAALRCRAEALKVAPESDGMVSTAEQLKRLRFCAAVFKEALRLRTPAPRLSFTCTEDFTMKSGRVLKKGTAVLTLNRAVGISEDFFTRGDEFVPERWISSEREKALSEKQSTWIGKGGISHEEEAFLSMGHGPRICPGQDMAKAEGAIIIAAICARFDLSLAPGQADPPEEYSSFTCGPKEFNMILTRTAKDE